MPSHASPPRPVPPRPLPRPESRPPWWTFVGGAMLSAIAGYVNAVVLVAGELPVTHLTGSVSQVSGDLARGDLDHALTLGMIVAAFIAGAAVSGALVGDSRLRSGRPYGMVMLLEAAMLAAAALTLDRTPTAALAVAAAAAGLQNAMASSYGRLILRTTHLTGIATDIGLLLGRLLRGDPAAPWTFGLLSLLFTAFAGAGAVGWIAATEFGGLALLMPAAVLLVAGIRYRSWRRQWLAAATTAPTDSTAPVEPS